MRSELTVQYDSIEGYMRLENDKAENLRFELILENPTWQRPGQTPTIAVRKYANNIKLPAKMTNALAMDSALPLLYHG